MQKLNRIYLIVLVFIATIISSNAQEIVLTNNGTGTSTWFISGEASLIINGFSVEDFERPVFLAIVSIDVQSPTPGQAVDVVVYQDANGGSPVDAELLGRSQVEIGQSGVFTASFETPLEITAPVVWAGFYLPVDFEFRADTSGTSVLTYWGWTPNSRFDLADLSTATVLGPGDGSAPVNIDMGGVAKITATIDSDGVIDESSDDTTSESAPGQPTIRQVTTTGEGTTAVLVQYDICETLYYDRIDIDVTYRNNFRILCTITAEQLGLEIPEGYTRRGPIYDIIRFGGEYANVTLPLGVTHCIAPPASDLGRAVFGLAAGSPRSWEILRSVRIDNFVCAEVRDSGYISYFVPNS